LFIHNMPMVTSILVSEAAKTPACGLVLSLNLNIIRSSYYHINLALDQ